MLVRELKESNAVSDATREEVLRRLEWMRTHRKRLVDQLEKLDKYEAEYSAMDAVEASQTRMLDEFRGFA